MWPGNQRTILAYIHINNTPMLLYGQYCPDDGEANENAHGTNISIFFSFICVAGSATFLLLRRLILFGWMWNGELYIHAMATQVQGGRPTLAYSCRANSVFSLHTRMRYAKEHSWCIWSIFRSLIHHRWIHLALGSLSLCVCQGVQNASISMICMNLKRMLWLLKISGRWSASYFTGFSASKWAEFNIQTVKSELTQQCT